MKTSTVFTCVVLAYLLFNCSQLLTRKKFHSVTRLQRESVVESEPNNILGTVHQNEDERQPSIDESSKNEEHLNEYLGTVMYNGTKIPVFNASSSSQIPPTTEYPEWIHQFVKKIVSRTPIPKDELELYYDRVLKEIPQASYPTYDYSALKEFLYPAYQQSEEENLKVPPLLHVTWFYKNNPRKKRSPSMQFWHAICLLAAHKKIKPYKILFWYDTLPRGEWWDFVVKNVPSLLLVYREGPVTIFNQTLRFAEHQSDVVRLEIIIHIGGIYIDLDTIAVNSFDPLRKYSAVQGADYFYSLANGILIGAPQNLFHLLFYLSYLTYNPKSFGGNSVLRGMGLARKYPDHIHIEWERIVRPNIEERFYFFRDGWHWNWSKNYCVHLYARYSTRMYHPSRMYESDTVIAQIYRHILWDEPVPPSVNRSPSLLEMSYWQQKHCNDTHYPPGLWNCAELNKKYKVLNEKYLFELHV